MSDVGPMDLRLWLDPATSELERVSGLVVETSDVAAETRARVIRFVEALADDPEDVTEFITILGYLGSFLDKLQLAMNDPKVSLLNSSAWLNDTTDMCDQCSETMKTVRDNLHLAGMRLFQVEWVYRDFVSIGPIGLIAMTISVVNSLLALLESPEAQPYTDGFQWTFRHIQRVNRSHDFYIRRFYHQSTPEEDAAIFHVVRRVLMRRRYAQLPSLSVLDDTALVQAVLRKIARTAWPLIRYRHKEPDAPEWTEESPESFECQALFFALEVDEAKRGVIGHLINDADVAEWETTGCHSACKNSWFCGKWRGADIKIRRNIVRDGPPPFPGAPHGWVSEEFTFAKPEDAIMMSICLNLLLSAILRKCENDIRLYHEQNPDLGFPLPEQLNLVAWDVLTLEPAYESVPEDEDFILEDDDGDSPMFDMDRPAEEEERGPVLEESL